MSLLTLLLGILSALAPLSGIRLPEPGVAAVPLPARELVLEPQCDHDITGREEECMLAAIRYRCELVGLRGVQIRRDGRNFLLQVNSGLIPRMEEYIEALDELEYTLNQRTTLQLLPVHKDSDILVSDGEVQELLVAYETAILAYEEGHEAGEPAPQLPALPARMQLQDYMLAEYQMISPEDNSARYEYLIVRRPEVLQREELLVTEQEVERAEEDKCRPAMQVNLTARGGDIVSRLTSGMRLGQDRLAIMLNGRVVSAPIVHAKLGCDFAITGMLPEQCGALVDGLAMPLPVAIKITARRSVE